jgi:hypothetical protein
MESTVSDEALKPRDILSAIRVDPDAADWDVRKRSSADLDLKVNLDTNSGTRRSTSPTINPDTPRMLRLRYQRVFARIQVSGLDGYFDKPKRTLTGK